MSMAMAERFQKTSGKSFLAPLSVLAIDSQNRGPQMSKFPNKTAPVVILLGLFVTIQVAIQSPKPIKLEIVTPLGWVSLNTWTGALK